MSDFEELIRGAYFEGLLIDGENLWYTDVTRGGVHNLATGQTVLPERTMVGGLLQNSDGALLVAGGGGIEWVNPATGAKGTLVTVDDGVNEMRADGQGGMFFGTIDLPAILRGETPGPSSIRHLARDGTCRVLKEGMVFANGLSLDASGTILLFNESFVATRAFPVGPDFALGEMQTLLDKPDCDGMALDVEGNAWISGFASGELICLTPTGEEVARLELPGPACTNVRFGGPDMSDLYVCIVDPADAQKLADGTPITDQNSAIYRTRAPVPGAPMGRTEFVLG